MEDDINHHEARGFLAQLGTGIHGAVVTTDYVLDEAMTLLRSRKGLELATSFAEHVTSSESVKIFWIDEPLFRQAFQMFRASATKTWSFTDCTSFTLMKELSLSKAFAFDSHFKEAGFSILPPRVRQGGRQS